MTPAALEGVRILDLSHQIAGPYCTKLLADYGADVVKIERPPAGDPARREGPFFQDRPHLEGSALFLHLNTNKQSVTLNLKSTLGREIALRLAAESDIVVENFRPGVMAELGLNYESLRAVKADIILTSISNFGQTGPYRDLKASELTLSAMGGPMNVTGNRHSYPLKLGGNVSPPTATRVRSAAGRRRVSAPASASAPPRTATSTSTPPARGSSPPSCA